MERRGVRALVVGALVAGFGAVLQGTERPAPDGAAMFRGGPAHTGVYAAAAGAGEALLGVRWRLETGGDVIGSPAVLGDAVFVGSGDGLVYAVDRASGVVRWKTDLASPIASSPAVAHGRVYVATRDGRLVALDARRGTVAWSVATGPDLPFPWGHESGDVYVSSPAVAGDDVFVGSGDGRVYAVDARTGTVRWRAATHGRVRSSPAVADGRVYVGSADGWVYAFDVRTGAERWKFETAGATLESQRFGFDRRTVQSSPAVVDGTVYVGARDGFLYALDAATGALRWKFDHKVSWVNSSPAVADGVVYAASSDGQFVQAVDARTGAERWRARTGVTWSSPAVAGDVVYSGDGAGRLFALDRATGRVLWFFRTGSQVWGSPVPAGDLVLVGSTDGSLYALGVGSARQAVARAVFFDSAWVRAAWNESAPTVAAYLAHRGYETLGVDSLGAWLRARAADRRPSVIVFAIDALPPSAFDSTAPERSPLRAYLDAGGKVVWPGMPPLLWRRDPRTGDAGGLDRLTWSAPSRLLGLPHDAAMFDLRGVRATDAGRRWGLPARWRGGWGIAPDPSLTVLGRDEWGLAASWVKRYGGPEGTGFVRVPPDELMAVYLAAEYRR